ncbi:hypothetical protein QQ045_029862 [Rhodiola kirilowii]
MAYLLQRLLRRQSLITIASLTKNNQRYQTLAPAIITHRSQSIDSRLRSILPSPLPKDESEKPEVKYDYFYPSFSNGLVVNPVFQKVVTEEQEVLVVVEEDENGSGKMWADSTKKKRKKKMNKHKYKKLMKRTRNH